MRRPSIPKRKRSSASKPGVPMVPKPSRKRPPLWVILALVVVIVGVFFVLRACDSDDEKEVRTAVERYAGAARDKDYQALCDDLLSIALVEQARSAGQPCEVALKIGLGDRKDPTLEIRSVKVDGDEALVEVDSRAVGEQPSQDTVRLIKEDDGWRISGLESEPPSDATP